MPSYHSIAIFVLPIVGRSNKLANTALKRSLIQLLLLSCVLNVYYFHPVQSLAFGPSVGPNSNSNGYSNVNFNKQPLTSGLQTSRLTPSSPSTTPLQRVLLHSKGTIQTFFSSYYNATTNIQIDSEDWVDGGRGEGGPPFVVNRRVTQSIVVNDKYVPYCYATSTIRVVDKDLYKNKGLAQMLTNKINRFELKEWGFDEEGRLWRNYVIGGEEVEAEVKEEFVKDCFDLLQGFNII